MYLIIINVVQEMVNLIIEKLVVIWSNPLPYLTVVKVAIFIGIQFLFEFSLFSSHPVWQLIQWLA